MGNTVKHAMFSKGLFFSLLVSKKEKKSQVNNRWVCPPIGQKGLGGKKNPKVGV